MCIVKFDDVILDQEQVKQHLGELVRGTVVTTLNKFLDAEAGQFFNAARHEQTDALRDTRTGHCQRKLHTKAGDVTLNKTKLRH